MTAEGHCNIVWGGDFKDTLRFQTSNFSFSFDATFRFADYIYRIFSENIDIIQFFEYNNVLSAVIFILEREVGVVSYKICGLDARNP